MELKYKISNDATRLDSGQSLVRFFVLKRCEYFRENRSCETILREVSSTEQSRARDFRFITVATEHKSHYTFIFVQDIPMYKINQKPSSCNGLQVDGSFFSSAVGNGVKEALPISCWSKTFYCIPCDTILPPFLKVIPKEIKVTNCKFPWMFSTKHCFNYWGWTGKVVW